MFFNCYRCTSLGLINRCQRIEAAPASEAQLTTMHKKEHIELLKSLNGVTADDYLEELSSRYDAIYFHPVLPPH